MELIDGVSLTEKRIISTAKGSILHVLKSSELNNLNVGEVYCSEVEFGLIKGWKKHTKMQLNIVVPVGKIRFVIFDDRIDSKSYGRFSQVTLSRDNYYKLTVEPGLWMAFQGIGVTNLLINVASIEHDPLEAEQKDLKEIAYNWD